MKSVKIFGKNLFPQAAVCSLIICLSLCGSAFSAAGGRASLTADRLDFDPRTNIVNAYGNVHLTRPDGEMFGDSGRGTTDGKSFEMNGNVKGRFEKDGSESVNIVCNFIRLRTEASNPPRRIIAASGDVDLSRGDDRITSDAISWEMDRDAYKASGSVIANYSRYYIDSDEVSRNGEKFSATGIRKYNDKDRDIVLSAARANGTFGKNGEITEMVAEGSVVIDAPDEKGAPVRITGDKGVFSVARGTFVISGNAVVNQTGRNLHAGSIVYHLDSERIEALGRPSLTIEFQK